MVRRHWGFLAVGLLIGTAGGLVHAYRQPRVYSASAQVVVGNETSRGLLPGESAGYYYDRSNFETQPLIIQSAPVAERAARSVDLKGLSPAQVQSAIRVSNVELTRVFAITAEFDTPQRARAAANAVADAYIEVSRESSVERARESVRWLANQLVDYEKKVQESHQAMIDYVENQNLTRFDAFKDQGAGQQTALVDDLERRMIDAKLEVADLAEKYAARHPDLIEKKRNVERLAETIREREEKLRAQEKKRIGYEILAGKARADLDLYGVLARKLEQANLTGSMQENFISVVQYAQTPTSPIRPNRKRTVLFGALAGVLFGLGLAFLRAHLDQRIQSLEDLTSLTELPVLAVIPEMNESSREGPPEFLSHSATPAAESFRKLRVNVKFARVGLKKPVIVVTSALPGEGKSLVTINLAAALASSGLRVVMVDGDLRRPTLHHYLRISTPESGLSTLLADGDPGGLDSALVRRTEGGADLLPAGPCPPNPGDLLESPHLGAVIERLCVLYDFVLIDSPPSIFADNEVLGAHAGGYLVVARSGVSERVALRAALQQLRHGGKKLLGLVMNGVRRSERTYLDYYREYVEDPAGAAAGAATAARAAVDDLP